MDRSGRSRALTPLIGVGLAVIVTGSLVTLGLLARGITLRGPLGAPVLPRATTAEAPEALVIGKTTPDANKQSRRTGSPERDEETVVAGIRIAADEPVAFEPAPARDDTRSVRKQRNAHTKTPFFDRERDGSTAIRDTGDDDKKSKHSPNGRALGHEKARGNGHAKHGKGHAKYGHHRH